MVLGAKVKLISLQVIVSISTSIIRNENTNFILLISGITFCLLIYLIVKKIVERFKKIFPHDIRLIEKDKSYWMGCRYILFRNELKRYKINKKMILTRIDYEIEQNNMTFIHKPTIIILITTLTTSLVTFITLFITKYFELIYFSKYKNFDLIIYCILINLILILIITYFLPIRTKNMKLKEFKHFIEITK
ncbi:hypothetical protein GCM10012288_25020 [Malaciobacter pacificus]|uniref:Putative membrane protein n=1 Tax=Malaciobacter pacificus TaxID=1080223 RepID=A0A5C2H8A4_9BACT|nr:putative membrane protein [Malaciobacter pacificus]GGD49973.1 hypothetical protein GCM10012288_25020 [Malaciobacter pacificus]